MSWELREKEFENVRQLPPQERYEYFVKKVADWQEMWSLWDRGWALLSDDEGTLIPVWPHSRFAVAFAVGEWTNYRSRRIGLDDWLAKWLPGMEADHRNVAVFPAEGPTATASPAKLRQDLEEELAKYPRAE
jgi:hypothetical protein